jgi:hypothetical protein
MSFLCLTLDFLYGLLLLAKILSIETLLWVSMGKLTLVIIMHLWGCLELESVLG